MKKYAPLLLLLSLTCSSFAQDYAPFRSVGEYFYRVNGSNGFAAYRIDSTAQVGADQLLYNYPSLNEVDGCQRLTNGWPGLIVQQPNQWTMVNHLGDSIVIRTNLSLDSTWSVYTFLNGDIIQGKITAKTEKNILGSTDSVITVGFQALTPSNTPITHEINDKTLTISKNHGIVSGFGFSQFPDNITDIELAGGSAEGFGVRRLPQKDYFFRGIGDVYHYRTNVSSGTNWISAETIGWRKEEVLDKITIGGIVQLITRVESWQKKSEFTNSEWEPSAVTITSSLDTIQIVEVTNNLPLAVNLPNQALPFIENLSNPGIFTVKTDQEEWMEKDGRLYTTIKTPGNLSDSTMQAPCFVDVHQLGGFYSFAITEHSEGLGITYKIVESGEFGVGGYSATEKLTYFKKGNEVWGTPIGIENPKATKLEVKIFPNPTRDYVQLQLESESNTSTNARIFSLDGRKVLETQLSSGETRIDLHNVRQGIYLLQLNSAGIYSTHRLVVNR